MSNTLYFDKSDRDLLNLVNSTVERGADSELEQKIFNTTLHPHGILSLATQKENRTAFAVINLLSSIAGKGSAQVRLAALRALYDEVVNSATTPFRINTGRVLVQIMKDIVRAKGNDIEQLKLIHDFRKVSAGNPRIVRSFLASRYLLEMPEDCSQLTMDQHVHDANSKGRKNPTYLIMDAWIKGIRSLTVIYYNAIEPQVVEELMAAASIMRIKVRVGIEFRAVFRNKYVDYIWAPRGFLKDEDVVEFFKSPAVQELMLESKQVNEWLSDRTYAILENFNKSHKKQLEKAFGIPSLPTIGKAEFKEFVGKGLASRLHLSDFIAKTWQEPMQAQAEVLNEQIAKASGKDLALARKQLEALQSFTPAQIFAEFMSAQANPGIPDKDIPCDDDRPEFLKMGIIESLRRVTSLRSGYRTTLQLANLDVIDVLEILWDARGMITHLERFNMKEFDAGELPNLEAIGNLQTCINQAEIVTLKNDITQLAQQCADQTRRTKLKAILENLSSLIDLYANTPLGSTFGTDSTGHVGNRIGMGLAVVDTLPATAQKQLRQSGRTLPVSVALEVTDTMSDTGPVNPITAVVRKLKCDPAFGMKRRRDFSILDRSVEAQDDGNIATIGGKNSEDSNDFSKKEENGKLSTGYLKTPILNILKVLFGLIPAFCTFMVTQNWWFLACFGAFIWLGITGFRNIIQMIIASGTFFGTRIRWYQAVQWTRLCESLMYTGWSVVLLEGLMRNAILVGLLQIKVTEHPLLVFTVIALANGTYISSHNIFRGFPMTAVVGNFFRSILAIPVALVYNIILQAILPFLTTMPVAEVLIYSSAIVTKLASDTIALMIEATADRRNFYRIRRIDLTAKLKQLYTCFVQLETLFPEKNMLQLLSKPEEFLQLTEKKGHGLRAEVVAHILDLMYMWFYQNACHQEFKRIVKEMSEQQREVFVGFQKLFIGLREEAPALLEDLLGARYSQCFAFYEKNHRAYFKAMRKLFKEIG